MRNIIQIQEQVESILRARFQYHICSIWYSPSLSDFGEVGTGNLLWDEARLFVMTCSHVAEKALSSSNFEIALTNGAHLRKHQIELYQSSEEDDIALLLVKDNVDLSDLRPLTLKDFELVDDFRKIEANSVFFVCGFPSGLVVPENKTIVLRPLFFQTVLDDERKPTEKQLYLEYPSDRDMPELPEALGLSGAGIWKMRPLANKNIWSTDDMKCIAIQHAWVTGIFVSCSPLTRLFEWLK